MGESGAHISNIDTKALQQRVDGVRSSGVPLGDWMHTLTAYLGIPHCGECEARRQKWNRLFRAAHADHPLDGYTLSRGSTGGVH